MKKTSVFSNETLARLFRALSLLLHAGISLTDAVYLMKEDESGSEADALLAMGQAMDGAPLCPMLWKKPLSSPTMPFLWWK